MAGRTRVSPRLQLDFRVVWHLKVPIGLYTAQVLKGKCDLAWLCSILDRHLAKVPRKLAEVLEKLFLSSLHLVGVVIGDLSISERQEQLLVHFCKLKAFPQVGDADLVVAYVCEAKKRVITFAVDLNRGLLDVAIHRLIELSVFLLLLDRGIEILCHLVGGEAYKASVELEAKVRLESDVDLLFRFGINHTFMIIKFKAAIKNLLDLSCLLALSTIALGLHHFQFDVKVALRFVGDGY